MKDANYFNKNYTVVTFDLSGHGKSGRDRAQWSIIYLIYCCVAGKENVGVMIARGDLAVEIGFERLFVYLLTTHFYPR